MKHRNLALAENLSLAANKIDSVKQTEVAISGGGIIGLSAALELARAGVQVTVFDRARAMAEASSAAAGMLAASDPDNPIALRPLAMLSARLYSQFLAQVEELSGERVPIRTRQTFQGSPELPEGFTSLTAEQLQAVAPGIVCGGLHFFSLDEGSLAPGDLAFALPKAVRAAGVSLVENTQITRVRERDAAVEIETTAGRWTAGKFVHASGAWAAQLSGLPVAPRKGQMVMIEEPRHASLKAVLRTPEIYLVPRGDRRIVVGATVEDAGFDKQIDNGAIEGLLDKAASLWPPVREARILESWAGLRPATPDALPVIDALGDRSWIAAGHFRNGILLAPATAQLLRQMILDEPADIDLRNFSSRRFASAAQELSVR
ncbi:MAG: FAD-dependent oxidoreductase [Silvibacterium sp.]|nr:FAD-dependent oxidoreductase [Silvibacterium sp.]